MSRGVLWDERKDRINRAKHGVGFSEAEVALRDPFVSIELDAQHSVGEQRFEVLGVSDRGRLLFVVTTEAWDGTITIITARRAARRERHAYEDPKE